MLLPVYPNETPRKSTVYDYSDLRLHPDGTRVQKTTNLQPKLAQRTIQDARSNWIARDAGGLDKVPLFKKKKKDRVEEEEKKDGNVSAPGSSGREGSSVVDDDAGENGKRRSRRPDHRKTKRQKFLKNDDFLADNTTLNLAGQSDTSSSSLPHPSPDLLKCIHRFASEFYTERGQLLNTSRQYRKERKERRVKRTVDRGSSPSSHSNASSESQSKSTEKVDGNRDRSEEDASEGSDVDTTVGTKQRRRRKGRRRSEKLYVDMYKMFDGSAMMTLGVLVQEHIAHLLRPSIPDDWEREI